MVLAASLLIGCHNLFKTEPGIGKPVAWSSLPNWEGDNLSAAWQAIEQQCPRMNRRDKVWVPICAGVAALSQPSVDEVREFLQANFVPHKIFAAGGKTEGLITGYYEPLLNGSLTRSEKYAYPGNELMWIDDPYGSFFLQIQGSGRVVLEDGSVKGLDYADQNGHPYKAIGKTLVEENQIPLEEVSLFSIREWLKNNPSRADEILNSNPSYVFFTLRENANENARGSLNVPLTQERSIAVDRNVIPLGTPVWLDTTLPDGSDFKRLMVAQDTGGAISGHVRADVFFGQGDAAEQLAGEMNQTGSMYALLPIASEEK